MNSDSSQNGARSIVAQIAIDVGGLHRAAVHTGTTSTWTKLLDGIN
jgi:hypothetical protein